MLLKQNAEIFLKQNFFPDEKFLADLESMYYQDLDKISYAVGKLRNSVPANILSMTIKDIRTLNVFTIINPIFKFHLKVFSVLF